MKHDPTQIYRHRHIIFFSGLIITIFFSDLAFGIFGSFEFVVNILVLLIATLPLAGKSTKRRVFAYAIVVLVIVLSRPLAGDFDKFNLGLFFVLFFYYIYITYLLFSDILNTKEITSDIILGAFSGYILIGVIGFFVFSFMVILDPNSLNIDVNYTNADDIIYFSFITMTTIGYGDVTPQTPIAEKAAVLLGLTGQFYIAVIIALLVGKYTNKI